MHWSLLTRAQAPIPMHAIVAFAAVFLGALQLALPKGGARHRMVGGLFVAAMACVAISAIWINEIQLWGLWSPIHLLIPLTLYTLWDGVRAARAGRIAAT
mgnify:CR=1 FL=1